MINTSLLKSFIYLKGYNIKQVADLCGIRQQTFYAKMNNNRNNYEFRINDIKALKKALGLTPQDIDNIFFN